MPLPWIIGAAVVAAGVAIYSNSSNEDDYEDDYEDQKEREKEKRRSINKSNIEKEIKNYKKEQGKIFLSKYDIEIAYDKEYISTTYNNNCLDRKLSDSKKTINEIESVISYLESMK